MREYERAFITPACRQVSLLMQKRNLSIHFQFLWRKAPLNVFPRACSHQNVVILIFSTNFKFPRLPEKPEIAREDKRDAICTKIMQQIFFLFLNDCLQSKDNQQVQVWSCFYLNIGAWLLVLCPLTKILKQTEGIAWWMWLNTLTTLKEEKVKIVFPSFFCDSHCYFPTGEPWTVGFWSF